MVDRRRLNGNNNGLDFSALLALNTKFPTIYIDPPWRMDKPYGSYVRNQPGRTGHAGERQHYITMSMVELKQVPVPALAADPCALFMWSTCSGIDKALELIDAWEFKFSTIGFIWVKTKKKSSGLIMGQGWWTRMNCELCLLATKGHNPLSLRLARNVNQVVFAPRLAHSEKPPEVAHRIERLASGPYLELFARKAGQNSQWKVWGNEARRVRTFFDEDEGATVIRG